MHKCTDIRSSNLPLTETVNDDVADPAGFVTVTWYIPPCLVGDITELSSSMEYPGDVLRYILVIAKPPT